MRIPLAEGMVATSGKPTAVPSLWTCDLHARDAITLLQHCLEAIKMLKTYSRWYALAMWYVLDCLDMPMPLMDMLMSPMLGFGYMHIRSIVCLKESSVSLLGLVELESRRTLFRKVPHYTLGRNSCIVSTERLVYELCSSSAWMVCMVGVSNPAEAKIPKIGGIGEVSFDPYNHSPASWCLRDDVLFFPLKILVYVWLWEWVKMCDLTWAYWKWRRDGSITQGLGSSWDFFTPRKLPFTFTSNQSLQSECHDMFSVGKLEKRLSSFCLNGYSFLRTNITSLAYTGQTTNDCDSSIWLIWH